MYDLGADGKYSIDDGGEIQITKDTEDQVNAAIHGNKIVWEDFRNIKNYDIYMYELSAGKEIPIKKKTKQSKICLIFIRIR